MYLVVVRRYVRTKSPKAQKPYRCAKRSTYRIGSPAEIADLAVSLLREAGKGMRYSGMEEFGESHGFWSDDHVCPDDGPSDECEELELESCQDWIEKQVRDLRVGESLSLHLGLPDEFLDVDIKAL